MTAKLYTYRGNPRPVVGTENGCVIIILPVVAIEKGETGPRLPRRLRRLKRKSSAAKLK
jgi:hypothetical protein